jgi:YceI-like domain
MNHAPLSTTAGLGWQTCGRLLIGLLFFASLALGQTPEMVSYEFAAPSEVKVTGTSTLHDWHLTTAQPTGTAAFIVDKSSAPTRLERLGLSIAVASLHSGKSGLDKNAYKALNAKVHQNMVYEVSEPAPVISQADGSLRLSCQGKLTVAGVTKPQSVVVTCRKEASGGLICSGSLPMKMSDYNVVAPVLMLGTLKTGDDITVAFTVRLQLKSVR